MSLNFDLSEVCERLGKKRWDEITTKPGTGDGCDEQEQWHPITDALIWASMATGLPTITEKNVQDWVDRMAALQALSGGELHFGDNTHVYITRDDIKNHIGMRTNASPLSKTAFYKQLYMRAVDKGTRGMRGQDRPGWEITNEKMNAALNEEKNDNA